MYNFSGLWHRIWNIGGLLIFLGLLVLTLAVLLPEKDKRKGKRDALAGIALVLCGICFGLFYYWRIAVPDITAFEGYFVKEVRNARTSPGNWDYTFTSTSSKTFCLDRTSLKEMCPEGLEKGELYQVYYDSLTKIIVKIEKLT